MKSIFFAVFTVFLSVVGYSQTEKLVGVVDDQIVEIDDATAQITPLVTISNLPFNAFLMSLTWIKETETYWGVWYDGTNFYLFKMTEGGVFTDLGPLMVNGSSAYIIEGIAFNRATKKLYVSASLNAGMPHSDYYSESFVQIDTNAALGTVINTFSHPMYLGFYESEADLFTFTDAGMMYYADAHDSHHNRFYKTDEENTSIPNLIYDQSYQAHGDMAFKDGKVFYIKDRKLYQFDTHNSDAHSLVGTMHTSNQYNGEVLRCITLKDEKRRAEDVGLEELSFEIETKIYPNPTTTAFNIEIINPELQNREMDLKVYSANGSLVYESQFTQQIKVDCPDWSKGNYYVRIKPRNYSNMECLILE